jgi:hypothetical protein
VSKNKMDINNLTDADIEYMRTDLDNNMAISKLIMFVKNRMEKEGKDFDEEFKKWKENNGK